MMRQPRLVLVALLMLFAANASSQTPAKVGPFTRLPDARPNLQGYGCGYFRTTANHS